MSRFKQLFALAGVTLIVTTASNLASGQIVWSSPTDITGPSDVSMDGTFISAASANNAHADYTVGDVTFDFGSTPSVTLPNIGGGDGDPSPTPSTASMDAANYNLALEGCAYVNTGGETATIVLGSTADPLAMGRIYQVEIWDSTHFGGRETTFTDGSSVTLDPSTPSGGTGQFALGTFTATAATESITFESTPGSLNASYGEVNDVLLRELPVPEPSTYAMILGGVTLLGFILRRKGATVSL